MIILLNFIEIEFQIEVLLYKLQGNEFRLTPFKLKRTDLCATIANDVYLWPNFLKQNPDFPKTCPIPKVLYWLNFIEFELKISRNFRESIASITYLNLEQLYQILRENIRWRDNYIWATLRLMNRRQF